MKLKDLERWLTPSDAAEVLGISRQAVHQVYIDQGRLRAVRTRQGWLIDPDDVARAARERASSWS
jgi:excisionase family DNA binding protein